ncbi:MAG: hypothetical protein RLZZ546_355 [Bacteroidota bacterium]
MLVLITCILLNVLVGVIFRYFGKYNIDLLQAIVVNYFTCVITASVSMGDFSYIADLPYKPWLIYAVIMGFVFMSIFRLIGKTVHHHGVMVASTAQKLSMITPVIVAILYFNEELTILKFIGLICSLIAVFFISFNSKENDSGVKKSSIFIMFLPLFTWLGSSFVDLSLFLVNKMNIAPNEGMIFTSTLFLSAGILGFFILVYQSIFKSENLNIKSLSSGIVLGIPNFFSIYLVIVLLEDGWQGSVVFPIMNVGIILISAMLGYFIFGEKVDRNKAMGLALALIAIIVLSL